MLARAECQASATGQSSFEQHLSARSGFGCFIDVQVYDGAACAPDHLRWSASLGCSETRRAVVTDSGSVVVLLAPRPNQRRFAIVRVFARDGDRLAVRSIAFDQLPGAPPAPSRPHLTLTPTELRIEGQPAAGIPLDRLVVLGTVSAHRRMNRLRPPRK